MSIAAVLLPEFDRETESTRKILACVPEEQFGWKPHPKSMSLGQLASHLAETCHWTVETMTKTEFSPPAGYKPWIPASRAELLSKFDEYRAEARQLLANASDEEYAENWTMSWGGKKIIDDPRATVIRTWVMNHMIHHRAQLGVYLRLQDIAVPGRYGPSAGDMAVMQNSA